MSGYHLTVIRTFANSDYVWTHTGYSEYLSAAEAQRNREQRLRDAGRSFTSGPGWLEHDEDRGHPELFGRMRLEWRPADSRRDR